MASPTTYTVSYDFTAFQVAQPTTPLPADKVEIELNNIATSVIEIITNLNLIQDSEGDLTNNSVTLDSLTNEVKLLLGSPIDPKGDWVTATSYEQLDLVNESDSSYLCVTDHTSGVFATDLAAGKWILFAAGAASTVTVNNDNWSGADLSVANGGTGVSTLTGIVKGSGTSAMSAAVDGVDYYAPSGTDVAVADGGTGASTAASARTNLGLGAVALLNTINNDNWSGADLSVANGGTGASTAADARTNLDVPSKGEVAAIVTAWAAYTPSVTHTSGGATNYTAAGKYRIVGDTLEVTGSIVFSSTSAAFSGVFVSIPAAYVVDTTKMNGITPFTHIGNGTYIDAGVGFFVVQVNYNSTTTVGLYTYNTAGTYAFSQILSNTAPATVANGDTIYWSFKVPITAA